MGRLVRSATQLWMIGAICLWWQAGAVGQEVPGGPPIHADAPGSLPPLPLSYPLAMEVRAHPELLRQLQSGLSPVAPDGAPTMPAPAGSPWQGLTNPLGTNASNPLLLTDGTVLVHVFCSPNWYRLTPDINGSYVNGTWSSAGVLPSGYTPLYFASQVLPDGRVVVNGGEYNASCKAQWTSLGAIYDPATNIWSSLAPPFGWNSIGDAQSIVLAAREKSVAGTKFFNYMLANALTSQQALLNTSTLTWTATGTGKFDINDEEGWTLLPDSSVLTVDASCGRNTERYKFGTGAWTSAGDTPSQLSDCANAGGPGKATFELGPQVLRPGIAGKTNPSVIAFAGITGGGVGNPVAPTAIFDTSKRKWSAGPNVPAVNGQNYTLADAPAALLPGGNVLFAASPSTKAFSAPTHFFEFNGSTVAQVTDTPDAAGFTSFDWNFLVLPTGQILACEGFGPNVWIYTPAGTPDASWLPSIASVPATLVHGKTYTASGRQFNGLSHGAAYGDDVQADTNYPLIRIVNARTNHVFYAKTFDYNTRSVKPGIASSTRFTVPSVIDRGNSVLYVVANGIPSAGVAVTVK